MSIERFALICGCNYSGNWKLFQSLNDALKFKEILEHYDIKNENAHTLFNKKYTKDNILRELKWLASKLNSDNKVGLIYVAGHGTQTYDKSGDEVDGRDENWQTYDRQNVSDDEITKIMKTMHKQSRLTIVSDTCCSGSMLDMDPQYNWITIGASLDNQSANQSGDGSVCSSVLFKIIKEVKDITIEDLEKLLRERMKNSFIGELQTAVVHVSKKELLLSKIFS